MADRTTEENRIFKELHGLFDGMDARTLQAGRDYQRAISKWRYTHAGFPEDIERKELAKLREEIFEPARRAYHDAIAAALNAIHYAKVRLENWQKPKRNSMSRADIERLAFDIANAAPGELADLCRKHYGDKEFWKLMLEGAEISEAILAGYESMQARAKEAATSRFIDELEKQLLFAQSPKMTDAYAYDMPGLIDKAAHQPIGPIDLQFAQWKDLERYMVWMGLPGYFKGVNAELPPYPEELAAPSEPLALFVYAPQPEKLPWDEIARRIKEI